MVQILLMCFLLLLAMPLMAEAQDNVIKVINEDGSVTEFELPDGTANAPVSITIRRSQTQQPVPAERQPVKKEQVKQPIEKKQPEANQRIRGAGDRKEKAKKKELVNDNSEEKETIEKVEKASKRRYPPRPGRKPLLPQKVRGAAENLPPETAIPKNLAISIAIQYAPPSKDFKVLRRIHNDIPVYAVVFKTEGKPYVVLVDARNGDVISD